MTGERKNHSFTETMKTKGVGRQVKSDVELGGGRKNLGRFKSLPGKETIMDKGGGDLTYLNEKRWEDPNFHGGIGDKEELWGALKTRRENLGTIRKNNIPRELKTQKKHTKKRGSKLRKKITTSKEDGAKATEGEDKGGKKTLPDTELLFVRSPGSENTTKIRALQKTGCASEGRAMGCKWGKTKMDGSAGLLIDSRWNVKAEGTGYVRKVLRNRKGVASKK